MPYDANFRTTAEYLRIIQELFATTFYKNRLSATDIVVIATTLGIVGTEPIRKNTKVPEMGEVLIQEGMTRGKEVFKKLAASVAILGSSRRNRGKKPLFVN